MFSWNDIPKISVFFLSWKGLNSRKFLLCVCSINLAASQIVCKKKNISFILDQAKGLTGTVVNRKRHWVMSTVLSSYLSILQGYPQRMRLHWRLYEIYTSCFLIFTIFNNFKLLSFFAKLLQKTVCHGRRLNLTLGLS